MKNQKFRLIRGGIFLIVLLITVWSVQGIFGVDSDRSIFNIKYFYREKQESMDAVFIGASNVHASWQPAFGWDEYGIAVWNFSVDSLPPTAMKYYLIEAQKTQPGALFIVNLNVFRKDTENPSTKNIHWAVDYLPLSVNKSNLIQALVRKDKSDNKADTLEYYLPIIRFHSRWDNLKPLTYGASDTDYKASILFPAFNRSVEDLSGKMNNSDSCRDVPEEVLKVFNDLLLYCENSKANVLFVTVPQAVSEEEVQRMNELEKIAIDHGFRCLNIMKAAQEIGINPKTDYYNTWHTNVHGSLKFSDYLGRYLVENYGFTDKRGQPGWESWDKAAAEYIDYLSPWSLPFEREHAKRVDTDIPKVNKLSVEGRKITVSWNAVQEGKADGYQIYRKCDKEQNGYWHLVASVDADTLSYRDKRLKKESQYTYTVVPFTSENDEILYGNFNVLGVSAKTGGE